MGGMDKLRCSALPLQLETMLGFLYIPSLSWPLLLALDMTRLSLVPVERAQVHVKPSCGFTLHPLQTGNCTQGSSHKASCQGDPVTWTVLVTEPRAQEAPGHCAR